MAADPNGRPPLKSNPLNAVLAPKNVAVIGASDRPGEAGRSVLWNLISNPFGGTVFPVNPNLPSILGIKAYPNIGAVPERLDLAVIVTAARDVPDTVAQCVDAGVRGAIILSGGFLALGAEGAELERRIAAQTRAGGMRIIGPNSWGVMSPMFGLNATIARGMAEVGSVGFISQSRALSAAVLDWSHKMHLGFSHVISVGSMIDVGWGDLIDFLGDDPHTKSIVIYMESIGPDARSFLSAAREAAFTKPIIVIKTGRTSAAAKAASHSGVMTGADEVMDAAFRRCGVLRVNTIAELFYMAEVIGKQPRPKGQRLTIVTNAGAAGVLATDALINNGGELAALSEMTMDGLNRALPAQWSHGNPIDVLGDATPERYASALEIAAADPNTDGLLVVVTPQAATFPTRTAELVSQCLTAIDKPILASWMGGTDVAPGQMILNRANVPSFPYPDTAARMFTLLWKYSYNLRSIYETPAPPKVTEDTSSGREEVEQIIKKAKEAGRGLLTEIESKRVLAAYQIPVADTRLATSEEEAVRTAEAIGMPVVLKLYSETITHKTDVGGVQLNLGDEAAVRRAYRLIESSVAAKVGAQHFQGVAVQKMIKLEGYEIIIGSSVDENFGPVVLFGSGGQLVEVYRDRALALPPLNTTLARRLMEQTRIYTALKGVRGRQPTDIAGLEQVLVQFSQLVMEQPWIKEIDINPLIVGPERIIAIDARVVLHDASLTEDRLPRLPIRPYPTQYTERWTMADGTAVTFRPIQAADEPLLAKFHETLSDRSVYLRYFDRLDLDQRIAHERLLRKCCIDYDREMAIVAKVADPFTGERRIVGVGRLTKVHGTKEAEFVFVVSDDFQGRGLGTEIVRRLKQVARAEGIERLVAEYLAENVHTHRILEEQGFKVTPNPNDSRLMWTEIDLTTP